jgi:hypothetical protein
VSGRIPAIKRRLPEDDLRGAHPKIFRNPDLRIEKVQDLEEVLVEVLGI